MRTDLIQARKAKGLSQQKLADQLGVIQGTISKIETGRQSITVEQAPMLAEALGLDVLKVLYPDRAAA